MTLRIEDGRFEVVCWLKEAQRKLKLNCETQLLISLDVILHKVLGNHYT